MTPELYWFGQIHVLLQSYYTSARYNVPLSSHLAEIPTSVSRLHKLLPITHNPGLVNQSLNTREILLHLSQCPRENNLRTEKFKHSII